MGLPSHNLDALEQRRLTLKENILQLQKSLYHWRTWEAEYDGLRDEIKTLPDDATTDDFIAVGSDFGGVLVTEEEMQTIFGTHGAARSSEQIVSLLGRRIDYVKQNVTTMEKRLRAAEDELIALDMSESALVADSADFPMREIMEELDENGRVISGSVNTPGDQAPQLLEVLKKVGVENIPNKAGNDEDASEGSSTTPLKTQENANTSTTKSQRDGSSTTPTPEFEVSNSPQVEEIDLSEPVSIVTDEDRKQPPVTDIDESLEDAQLRREMFQYGIDEVGAIVAELELDEDGSDVSFDEDYAWATDEDGEAEDEFGRSRTELSEEYHKQMRELEEKLNARGMWNMGKDSQTFPSEVREEVEAAAAAEDIQPDGVAESSSKARKPKKRVAFADDLDIAPAEAPHIEQIHTTARRTLPPKSDVAVLSDAIVERTDRVQDTPPTITAAGPPKKASRFKSARTGDTAAGTTPKPVPTNGAQLVDSHSAQNSAQKQANAVPSASLPALFPATPQTPKPFSTPILEPPGSSSVPQPPQGKTLADTLVEREIAAGTAPAPELDDLDEEIHRREIATEFYKMRNHMIQQKGGFVNNEEPEMVPLETEEPPKRMSKFRAARMNQ